MISVSLAPKETYQHVVILSRRKGNIDGSNPISPTEQIFQILVSSWHALCGGCVLRWNKVE